MNVESTWETLLHTPHARDHFVQLYTDDEFLARAVTLFVDTGLAAGEAAVIIATPAHIALFTERLVDAEGAMARGQLVVLDAAACLKTFMTDGMPDRAAFIETVATVLDRVRAVGYPRIRLYGEMVDLLWHEDACDAGIKLEELWNELLSEQGLPLLCTYRIDNFDPRAHRGPLARISATHSHLIPVDDYPRLDRAVERAYADVFGDDADAENLRQLLATTLSPAPVMPSAQAALFALREVNGPTADDVLERARSYYLAP